MTRRLLFAAAALTGVLVVGMLGYVAIEGWSPLDSLYMTVITVGTVGFREMGPLSTAGKLFTMGLIIAGVGALGFSLGTFIDFILEGHLTGILEARRMESRIKSLTDHYILAGMGRVGSVVARMLHEEGVTFVVIDHDEETLEGVAENGWLAVHGDATDERTLRDAGVERARGLVTALDTDAENTFVTLSARALNPEIFIVSRSSNETSEAKLRKAGANRVMTPTVVGGRRMATMVLHPVVADYLDLISHGGEIEFRLEELDVSPGSKVDGKTIGELRIRHETGAFILAIKGLDGAIDTNPWADTSLRAGDRLVVFGTPSQLRDLTSWL